MNEQAIRWFVALLVVYAIAVIGSSMFPWRHATEPDMAKHNQSPKPATSPTEVPVARGTDTLAGRPVVPPKATSRVAARDEPVSAAREPARIYTFDVPRFRVTFTSHGGAVRSWSLNGHQYENRSGPGAGPIELIREPAVTVGDHGALSEPRALTTDIEMIVDHETRYRIPSRATWELAALDRPAGKIDFVWNSADGRLRVEKKFELLPEDYVVKLTINIVHAPSMVAIHSVRVSTLQYGPGGADGAREPGDRTSTWKAACMVDGDLFTDSPGPPGSPGRVRQGSVDWAGFTQPYFLVAISPIGDSAAGHHHQCSSETVPDAEPGTTRSDLVMEARSAPGGVSHLEFAAFLGPKRLETLTHASQLVGKHTHFDRAVELGFFAVIIRPLLWLLTRFHELVSNWGVAIILLTLLVKMATLPWTTKSSRSMRSMVALKPHVDALRQRHKDDLVQQQLAISRLYKEHGVGPLAGCLPMLLQMPIWLSLYRMLRLVAELFQAPFVPGWIDDLTVPDPYHVLPCLILAVMILQFRLNPSVTETTTQKVLKYGMPLSFGVFCFLFPAGLTLYILTNTTITTLHTLWINNSGPALPLPAADQDGALPSQAGRCVPAQGNMAERDGGGPAT